jgi:hypothetical protein
MNFGGRLRIDFLTSNNEKNTPHYTEIETYDNAECEKPKVPTLCSIRIHINMINLCVNRIGSYNRKERHVIIELSLHSDFRKLPFVPWIIWGHSV